jgi:hypothetical protein
MNSYSSPIHGLGWVRRLAPDGLEVWKLVIVRGYEGYVAKDEASVYEGGQTRQAQAPGSPTGTGCACPVAR